MAVGAISYQFYLLWEYDKYYGSGREILYKQPLKEKDEKLKSE